MAQLPSFATLVKSYPYKPAGLSHRVEPVPGAPWRSATAS